MYKKTISSKVMAAARPMSSGGEGETVSGCKKEK